jgi:sugar lactone lactonase YvrE
MALFTRPCLWSGRQQATIGTRRPAWVVDPDELEGATMPMPRSARAVLAAATALLLFAPTAAVAKDGDRGRGGEGRPGRSTTTYLLEPTGPAADGIFPEGVAVDGDTFYVGSTTDGTIYRGDLDEEVATPFLLPGNPEGRTFAVGLKVDDDTLFVAGGPTGRVFAYDVDSGELTGSWVVDPAPAPNTTFLNDLIVTRSGDVYVTDSIRPILYRIDEDDRETDGTETLEEFIDFTGTELQYTTGFNVNGIAVSPNDRYLVLVQSNTGSLFRVDLQDESVDRIDLGGALVNGDGLVLRGNTLYAVERAGDVGRIVKVQLRRQLTEGTVVSRTTDPTFDDPTTAALVRGTLLVVNSQFGERAAGEDPDPFTVSRIPAP